MASIEEQIEIYARRIVNAAFPEVEGKLEQNVYCTRALRLLRKDLVIAAADPRRCPLCRRGHWHTDVLLEALQTIAKSSGPTDPSAQEIARQALRELAEIGLEALAKRDVDVLRERKCNTNLIEKE